MRIHYQGQVYTVETNEHIALLCWALRMKAAS